jgi:hypothetical protein
MENDGPMSETFKDILNLVRDGVIVVSNHGYDELAEDSLTVREIISGIATAIVVEDYPVYPKGRCVLVLQQNGHGKPVHVVWGIPKNSHSPAVLITAYRPDPSLWSVDFLRRKP